MKKFHDPYWDLFLFKLINGSFISKQEKLDFMEQLNNDSVFREDFCEWMKTLREPALAWKSLRSKERKAS